MNTLRLYNGNLPIGIFDFDGNILNTETPTYFRNKNTGEVHQFLAHEVDQNPEIFFGECAVYEEVPETYSEARDFFLFDQHRGFDGFINDVIKAIKEDSFASSFEAFKNMFLVKARIFSILTARGNATDNFHKAFTMINQYILTKEEKEEQHENIIKNYGLNIRTSEEQALYHYLGNIINYIPCNNPQVEKLMEFEGVKSPERKAKSMDFLIPHYIRRLEQIYQKDIATILDGKALSIGFSDDSIANIEAVYHKFYYILQNGEYNPNISKKMSVYFTGKQTEIEELLGKLGDPYYYKSEERPYGTKIKLIV